MRLTTTIQSQRQRETIQFNRTRSITTQTPRPRVYSRPAVLVEAGWGKLGRLLTNCSSGELGVDVFDGTSVVSLGLYQRRPCCFPSRESLLHPASCARRARNDNGRGSQRPCAVRLADGNNRRHLDAQFAQSVVDFLNVFRCKTPNAELGPVDCRRHGC